MTGGFQTDLPMVRSLSAVLDGRGQHLQLAARTVRGTATPHHADIAAGLGFARTVLGEALQILGDSTVLTGQKVDHAVTVYVNADRTTGKAIGDTAHNTGPRATL